MAARASMESTESMVRGFALERLGEGEPLLLLHGTGGARMHWRPVLGPLAERCDVIAVDLPGHGASSPPPEGTAHNPIGYAELLGGVLDELGLDSAHVAGNSAGGWTALELAKNGRARSVVAIGPAGLWAKQDPLALRLRALEPAQAGAGLQAGHAVAVAQPADPRPADGRLRRQAGAAARRGGDRADRGLRRHARLQGAPARDETSAVLPAARESRRR